jgi:hypothetical protein
LEAITPDEAASGSISRGMSMAHFPALDAFTWQERPFHTFFIRPLSASNNAALRRIMRE